MKSKLPVTWSAMGLLAAITQIAPASVAEESSTAAGAGRSAVERFAQRPGVFIENQGQWADPSIRFALNSHSVQVGCGADGVRFRLSWIVFQELERRAPARPGVTHLVRAERELGAPIAVQPKYGSRNHEWTRMDTNQNWLSRRPPSPGW
jgi:hypothetical protein